MIVKFSETVQANNLDPSTRETLRESVAKSSARLQPWEHDAECPVAHGASCDCCWPLEVCVEDGYVPPFPVKLTLQNYTPRLERKR